MPEETPQPVRIAAGLKTAVILLLPLAWIHRFDAWKILLSYALVTAPLLLCLPLFALMVAICMRGSPRLAPATHAAMRALATTFARLADPGPFVLVVLACAMATQLWLHKGSPLALAPIPALAVFGIPWFTRDMVAFCTGGDWSCGARDHLRIRILSLANVLFYAGFFFLGITTRLRFSDWGRIGTAVALTGLGGGAAWLFGSCVAAVVMKGRRRPEESRQAFDLWLSADRLALLFLLVPALAGIGFLAVKIWSYRREWVDLRLLRVLLAFSTCGLLVAAHGLIRPLEVWCRNRAPAVPPWGLLAVLNALQTVALLLSFAIVFRT